MTEVFRIAITHRCAVSRGARRIEEISQSPVHRANKFVDVPEDQMI